MRVARVEPANGARACPILRAAECVRWQVRDLQGSYTVVCPPPIGHHSTALTLPLRDRCAPVLCCGRYAMRGLQIPYATPYTWNGTSLPDAPPLAQRHGAGGDVL